MSSSPPGNDFTPGLRILHDQPPRDSDRRKGDPSRAGSTRHARFGPGKDLRRQHDAIERAASPKLKTLPIRLRISAYARGVYKLDIAICDIKISRRPTQAAM